MPEVTIVRQNWLYESSRERKVYNNVDVVNGKEMFFRWEVSDWIYNILMNGDIREHDNAARKILKDNK